MKKLILWSLFLIIFLLPPDLLAQTKTPAPTSKPDKPNVDIHTNIVPTKNKVEGKITIYIFIRGIFDKYKKQIYIWLGVVAAIYTIGVYGIFFPLLYYLLHLHPSIAIRVSYVMALFSSYLVFHFMFTRFWLRYWVDYRMWVVWFLVMAIMSLGLILMPRNRKAF